MEEVVHRNLTAVLETLKVVRRDYNERIINLENTVQTLSKQLTALERQHQLLLTERFDHGPTAPDEEAEEDGRSD